MTIPADHALVSMYHTLTNFPRPAVITFGVNNQENGPDEVCDLADAAWKAAGSLHTIIDSGVKLTRVRVQAGTDGPDDITSDKTYATPATMLGTALPPNCAVLVHKITTRGGRRGRGRMFLPWAMQQGLAEEAGGLPGSEVVKMIAACGVFLGKLTDSGIPMVLLHQDGKSDPGFPNLVTNLRVDSRISTQRRRLGR